MEENEKHEIVVDKCWFHRSWEKFYFVFLVLLQPRPYSSKFSSRKPSLVKPKFKITGSVSRSLMPTLYLCLTERISVFLLHHFAFVNFLWTVRELWIFICTLIVSFYCSCTCLFTKYVDNTAKNDVFTKKNH